MKTLKHTPGPWLLNHNTNWKTNPFSVTVRKRGVHSTTVANIPTRMTIPPQEQQANATLLSTAPEMLDVLLRARDAIEALDGTSAENERLVDDYRVVIARATGDAA